jgi:hypothetical protein
MSILSLHPGRVRKDNRALCILSIRYSQRHKIVGYFHGTTSSRPEFLLKSDNISYPILAIALLGLWNKDSSLICQ